jgi:hypothetical protein
LLTSGATVISEYQFMSGWCVTPACFQYSTAVFYYNMGAGFGTVLTNAVCFNDFGNASCTDPGDQWTVTCNPIVVDGVYDCSGTSCIPTNYGLPTCPGR